MGAATSINVSYDYLDPITGAKCVWPLFKSRSINMSVIFISLYKLHCVSAAIGCIF